MLAALLTTADALLPRKADPALAGEIAALRPLVRAVVAQVLREPFDHPDVEDVTQEALRRAVEGKSRPSGPPRPWLLGIARHVALDTIRGRRRDRGRFDDGQAQAAPESTPALLVERLADPASDVCESMLEQERRTRVLAAIARLPDGPRAALELFHGEGLAYAAIAERLSVPLGTVATWVTRGRRAIAEALAEDPELPPEPPGRTP
jgi:RNA polymerase sigma-70 factor (ECF subfamily)